MLIKCPECGREISNKAEICPNCGYPIQEKNAFNVNKIKQNIYANKKVFVPVVAIVVIGIIFTIMLVNKNSYKEYISYIGKDVDELPDGYEKQEIMDNYWLAEKQFKKGELKFSEEAGNITYLYSTDKFEAYDVKPNEVFSMSWIPEYDIINDSIVKKELKSLEKIWGKYDKKNQWDNTTDGYSYKDEDFLMTNYIWKDENGKEIIMRVEQEGDEYESIEIDIRKKPVET